MLFSPELNFTICPDSYTHELLPEFKTEMILLVIELEMKHTRASACAHTHTHSFIFGKTLRQETQGTSAYQAGDLPSWLPLHKAAPVCCKGEDRSWPQAGGAQHKSVVGG